MPEYVGTESQIVIQKRLRDRQPWIAETPGAANGGRILHFVDPESVGWDTVSEMAHEDRLAGFAGVPKDETIALIKSRLGPHWKTPVWNVFLGKPEQVLPACEEILAAVPLPDGWHIESFETANDAGIEAVQDLNGATGVSPYPAYYMRSEAVPVLTSCIHDEAGTLVATASAALRYHADCRLGGYLFAGMVSVSTAHRRKGLGRVANAAMLVESHKRFGWSVAKEQVAPDNPASRAMVEACGLDNRDGLVSVAAINSDEGFTR